MAVYSFKRASSLINLCVRAKLLVSGETRCEKALAKGEAKLVIISRDASDNTKKKFTNKAFYYGVPVVFFGGKQELGKLTGGGLVSSACVTDHNLSGLIADALGESAEPFYDRGGKSFVEDSNI